MSDHELERLDSEVDLRHGWDSAMTSCGSEEAFYNGDRVALIAALKAAIALMEE